MRIVQLVDSLVQFIADFDPYEHKDQANGQALFKSLLNGEVAPIRERLFLFAEESEVFEEIDRACELIAHWISSRRKEGIAMGNFGEIFRDLPLSETRASARELDMTLNAFGFSREKQWESVKNTGSEESMLDFALAWISFQAKEAEGTRYDGRNALSCQLAGKLQSVCDMQELRQQVSEAREDVDKLVKQLFDLHRTLKQRLTGFCFFVLEMLSDRIEAVNDAINKVCSEPFTFFAETGFDEHTTKFERSDWYRMPFI